MSKSEELLFEGIDFGDMFSVDADDSPIQDDTEEQEEEEKKTTKDDQEEFEVEQTDEDEQEDDQESDEDTEKDTDSETSSDESDDSSSSSTYQVFAKALYDEGVITSLDDDAKIESAEDLIKSIKSEITRQTEGYKTNLPPVVKEIIDKYEEGVDLTEFITAKKEEDDYASIKEDDLEENDKLSRTIIKRDLLENGYTEEEAEDELEDIFELGKQGTRAKRSLRRVKDRVAKKKESLSKEAEATRVANEKAYQEQLKTITKNIEETKEIAGVELTERQRKEALSAMTEIAGKIGDTPVNAITKSRMEDPMEFDKNVSLLWTITKGFKDWTPLKKTAKRRAIQDLEDNIKKTNTASPTNKKRKSQAPSGGFYPEETVFSNIKF